MHGADGVSRAGELFVLVKRVEREGFRHVDELGAGEVVSRAMDHVFSSLRRSASLAMASFTRIFTVPSGLAVLAAISLWLNPSK